MRILLNLLFSLAIAGFARTLWSLHEAPIDVDLLSKDICTVHCFLGCECLLVCLVLNQSVSLQKSGAAVKVQVDVFDITKLAELLLNVVFMCFFMD